MESIPGRTRWRAITAAVFNPLTVLIMLVLVTPAAYGRLESAAGYSSTPTAEASRDGADLSAPLLSDVAGMLDGYGRPTIFRLTFQPIAGVGPEDLPTPFIAYVESGSFVHRDSSGTYADVEVGTIITTERGDDYAIRNPTLSRGTLLVVSLPGSCYLSADWACEPVFLPYDFLCDTPCRPDITNTLLFNHQDTKLRYMPVLYTLQQTTLGFGETYTPVDLGGDGQTIYLLGRVDVGTVQTSTGEVYTAGQQFTVSPGQTLVSTGLEDAKLFVLRVAEE